MKIIPWAIPLFLALCITGCGGGSGWRNDRLPENEWNEDYLDCVQRSEMNIGGLKMKDLGYDDARAAELRLLIEKCMKDRGYYQKAGP